MLKKATRKASEIVLCSAELYRELAASALRLIRAVPNTVLIATARTTTALLCNVPRLIALPLAFVLVANGADMATAVGVGVVSEAIGLVLGLAAVSEARSSAPVPALSQAGGLS